MRGVLRSAFLPVAAARQPAEAMRDEQQQQQQDEELLRHAHAQRVAGTPLDDALVRSASRLLFRRLWEHGQTGACRMGSCAASSPLVETM